ncbi:HAD family hydrolase [Burkholderia sp. Ac-20379]|uniref:HAD family hydrolase n=1 Tax=Burkholderia sp. Ac-20379 TaxID=2703900 RepID=UPI00197F8C61|nr:HAD-IA family hydrolase [Burkholderia sp. Ac-20379]MBN3723253.1 HAD-IA family hydrolase [Burkholderia sp. Ac-20379]
MTTLNSASTSPATIQAVIFDCDGTLVDSEPIAIAALLDEARGEGFVLDRHVGEARFKGVKMALCVAEIERELGRALPDDFVSRVRARMVRGFEANLPLMPDAMRVIRELPLPYCVASNGPPERLRVTLGVSGLLPELRGPVISAYEVGHWKPSPALFLHAAAMLGVAPQHCAVVEDSAPGIEAGVAAGMTVFALCAEHEIDPRWRGEVVRIDRLGELLDRLA